MKYIVSALCDGSRGWHARKGRRFYHCLRSSAFRTWNRDEATRVDAKTADAIFTGYREQGLQGVRINDVEDK